MAAIVGWDRAIGSLLGAFLRGRAESQQAETLRKILEQQQRTARGLDDQMGVTSGSIPLTQASDQVGTFGNAPFVSPADTPMLPQSQFPQPQEDGILSTLGNALATAGRYTLEGMTPGNAEAAPLDLQVRQSLEEVRRKRSLADALALARAKAQFRQPGFTERMYEEYAKLHGPEAATRLWEQSQDRTGLAEQAIRALGPEGMAKYGEKLTTPQRTSMESLLDQMTPEQRAAYLENKAKGGRGQRPVAVKQRDAEGNMIVSQRNPNTGEVMWTADLPGNPLPVSQQNTLSGIQNTYALAKEVQNLWDPAFTGKEAITGAVRQYSTKAMQDKERAFRAAVQSLEEAIIRPKEGAVMPEEVVTRFRKFLPNLYNPDANFPINMQQFLFEAQNQHDIIRENARANGYSVQGYRLGGTSPQTPLSVSPQQPGAETPIQSRYRITSGPLKGVIVDSKDALMEMVKKGQLSPNDSYEEGR